MPKTQTFTSLSPAEATAEVTAALTAMNIAGCSVSSSTQEIGRQRKMYLTTVVSKLGTSAGAALAVLSDLPDVCGSGTMGRGVLYVSRRLH
jgi:uncharacterized membrane protein (DUF4010 family)